MVSVCIVCQQRKKNKATTAARNTENVVFVVQWMGGELALALGVVALDGTAKPRTLDLQFGELLGERTVL